MLFTILIALFSLIGLMVIHEFGHFILAKKFGVKVEEFGIGLPPRIFGKKIGETIYSLNLIPFGAFVKIYGEEGGIESAYSFSGKPIWQRALIILGGVVSFWLIGVVLLSVVFVTGVPKVIDDEVNSALINPRVQVVAIAPNSPAQKTELKVGDVIKKLEISDEQVEIDKVKEVQEFTNLHKGQEITLTIEIGKETKKITLIPRVSPPEGEGPIGISLVRTTIINYPLWLAPIKGIESTFYTTVSIIKALALAISNAVQGLPTGAQFVGPVGIANLIGQAARMGVNYFLQFIALISIYLAIFNILPIPAVDGGKLLFLGIEKIKGSPIKKKIEQNINAVFFTFLIVLMVLVTIKDIIRLF